MVSLLSNNQCQIGHVEIFENMPAQTDRGVGRTEKKATKDIISSERIRSMTTEKREIGSGDRKTIENTTSHRLLKTKRSYPMGNTTNGLPRNHSESQTSSIQPNVWRVEINLTGNEGYLFNDNSTDEDFEHHLISQPSLSNKRRNNGKGITPLFLATLSNRPNRVRLLLLHGAEPDTRCGTSSSTALHVACVQGCLEIIQNLLIHGANPSAIDDNGRTPLHAAAACEYYHRTPN